MQEAENRDAVCSMDMDITYIFIAQKGEGMMVKCKLHPGRKQLHYAANTSLAHWESKRIYYCLKFQTANENVLLCDRNVFSG